MEAAAVRARNSAVAVKSHRTELAAAAADAEEHGRVHGQSDRDMSDTCMDDECDDTDDNGEEFSGQRRAEYLKARGDEA